jgi:hypothetical protein
VPRREREWLVKKGRHRRYEEARKAKRGLAAPLVRCDECGGDAVHGHAAWCRAYLVEEEIFSGTVLGADEDGPVAEATTAREEEHGAE